MNKKLFLLPLACIAALSLTSCGDDKGGNEGGGIPADSVITLDDLAFFEPVEFSDGEHTYRIHEGAPEDGGSYYFGFYNRSLETLYFFHGGRHTDADGHYYFYLGCKALTNTGDNINYACSSEDTAGLSKIQTDYLDDTFFTMKVLPGGGGYDYGSANGGYEAGTYYDNAYLQFEPSTKKVYHDRTSITAVEEADLNEGGKFMFRNTIKGQFYIYSPVAWMQNPDDTTTAGSNSLEFKGFGTFGDYVSIGCLCTTNMTTDNQYIARLWEIVD